MRTPAQPIASDFGRRELIFVPENRYGHYRTVKEGLLVLKHCPYMLLAILLFCSVSVFAQGEHNPEIFLGYSNLQAEGFRDTNNPNSVLTNDFFRDRTTLHGINGEATVFPFDMFSLTGDLSFNRKKRKTDVTNGSDSEHLDTWYFMAGPSYVADTDGIVRPFVRMLFGGAHTSYEAIAKRTVNSGNITSSFDLGTTDFSLALGGGLDFKVGERVKVRVIQFDYAPIFLGDRSLMVLGQAGVLRPLVLDGQRQDNLRFSVGITF
jgi:opacity protein-like surface antigen